MEEAGPSFSFEARGFRVCVATQRVSPRGESAEENTGVMLDLEVRATNLPCRFAGRLDGTGRASQAQIAYGGGLLWCNHQFVEDRFMIFRETLNEAEGVQRMTVRAGV
jgi:hypothetical protein